MPKIDVKATELVGTDVSFVSMVKNGANRLPFRITKKDTSMLDLAKIGRTVKSALGGTPAPVVKEAVKPTIVAAFVKNEEALDQVAKLFQDAGLDPATFIKTEQDGIILVAKADAAEAEDTLVVRMSDEVCLAIAGLKKAFVDWDVNSTTFGDVMAQGGFCASVSVATDMLRHTMANILYDADTPEEVSTNLAKAVDEYKAYTVALASVLPIHAFKMDASFAKGVEIDANATGETADETEVDVEKAAGGAKGKGFEAGNGTGTDAKATADDKANTAVDEANGKSTTGDAKDKKVKKGVHPGLPTPTGFIPGDKGGFAAAPAESDAATARATADDKKMKQNAGAGQKPAGLGKLFKASEKKPIEQEDSVEELEAQRAKDKAKDDKEQRAEDGKTPAKKSEDDTALATLMETMLGLQKSVTEGFAKITGDVEALNGRVDTVSTQVTKTEAALNGTVYNEAGGDAPEPTKTLKTETGAPPLLDTAYTRRRNAA